MEKIKRAAVTKPSKIRPKPSEIARESKKETEKKEVRGMKDGDCIRRRTFQCGWLFFWLHFLADDSPRLVLLPVPRKGSNVFGARPDVEEGRVSMHRQPWGRYEILLLLSLVVFQATMNRRVNEWDEIALRMGTGRSAAEVSRFFYHFVKGKRGKRWIRRMARAKVGIKVLFKMGSGRNSYKNRQWKLWTTREKRILLFSQTCRCVCRTGPGSL
jgi:hypothetical protein